MDKQSKFKLLSKLLEYFSHKLSFQYVRVTAMIPVTVFPKLLQSYPENKNLASLLWRSNLYLFGTDAGDATPLMALQELPENAGKLFFLHFKTGFSYYFRHNFLCVHQKVFEGNWQPKGFIMLGKHRNLGALSAFSRCFWPAPASRRWRLWVHKQGCDAPKARNIQLPTPAFPNSWLKPQSPRWGIPLSLPERLKHFSTGDSWKTEALPERLKHFLKDWSASWKTEGLQHWWE